MHTQLHLGEMPQEHLWNPIKNRNFMKPIGGLWTSTFLPDGTSDWSRWCVDNDFLDVNAIGKWLLTPSPNAILYIVENPEDIAAICKGQSQRFSFATPDFEELMTRYDGITLTKQGQRNTRFSMPHSFYGWDCESTIWFRWMFDDVEELTRRNECE